MEIEARVTRALQALEAAREVWRRLRDTFQEPDPPAEPSPAALQAAHRRAVRQGLEAALRVAPVVIAAPSLKLYAAGAVR
jgi:hypothetical protein